MTRSYVISDGNETVMVDTLDQAVALVETWYDYLNDMRKEGEDPLTWNSADPDISTLDELNSYIMEIESAIAQQCGYSDFCGHGSYICGAASAMGLNLTVTREKN